MSFVTKTLAAAAIAVAPITVAQAGGLDVPQNNQVSNEGGEIQNTRASGSLGSGGLATLAIVGLIAVAALADSDDAANGTN